jgi:alcohol dehydrogenase (NADP+)
VEYALKAGYHHLDSAAAYGMQPHPNQSLVFEEYTTCLLTILLPDNEDYVGLGLSSSKLPRSAYWITSKLWNTAHRPSDVRPALEKTLSQLGIPYLDLYLIHWPVAFEPNKAGPIVDKGTTILDTWRPMEDLVRGGLTKHIGISNFAKHDVEDLLSQCKICPTAHEFESHPYLQQQDFVDFHHGRGIQVIAYSPLANINPIYHSRNEWPPILEDPLWVDIAKEKNVTPAQAILAWGIQRGTVVIPKSVHEGRIIENLASQSVRFNDEEMKTIAGQDKKARLNNPSQSWGIHLFDDLDGT